MSYTSLPEGSEPTYSLGNSQFVPYDFQFHLSCAIEGESLAKVRSVIHKYPNLIHAVWKSSLTRGVYKNGRLENKTHCYEIMQFLLTNFPDLKLTANIAEKTNVLHMLAKSDDFRLFSMVFNDSRVQASKMINESGYHGSTPLMCALESSCKTETKLNIIKLILTHPLLDINALGTCKNDQYEVTSMYGAIHCIRTLEEAQLIFAYPNVNVNLVSLDGGTILHPKFSPSPELLVFILDDPRVDANILNKKGYSPFHAYTASCGSYRNLSFTEDTPYYQCMKIFLEHPKVNVNLLTGDTEGDSALHIAIRHKQNDVLKLMLQSERLDVNIKSKRYGTSVVQLAFTYYTDFSLDYLKLLLMDRTRIEWTRENIIAVFSGYCSASVYKQLRRGTESDKIDYSHYANLLEDLLVYLVEGEKGESEKVLDFRDDKNMNNSYSPFYYAVYAGMIPIVRYLLSKGLFEINEICDQQGNTALLLATEHEDMEFVKYLVTVPSIDFTLRNKAGKNVTDVVQYRLSSSCNSDAYRFEAGKDTRKQIQTIIEEAIRMSRVNKLLSMVRPRVITSNESTDDAEDEDDHEETRKNDETNKMYQEENQKEKKVTKQASSSSNSSTSNSSSTKSTKTTSAGNGGTSTKSEENRKSESTNTNTEQKKKEEKKEKKPVSLLSLSISQCVDLVRKLFPSVDLKDIIEEEGINGVLLNEISSMEDIRDLRLDSKLKNIQARALLGALERLRKEGVTM